MPSKDIKKIYTKVLKLVKDMPPVDFYSLLHSLEKGFEAYSFLDKPEDCDDIDEIEEGLND